MQVNIKAYVFLIALLTGSNTAFAESGNVYGFGDSQSDSGRIARELNLPDPQIQDPVTGYLGSRATNGPTWIEHLPALVGRDYEQINNFAVSGATTSEATSILPGLEIYSYNNQVQDFSTRFTASSSDIAGVYIGVNNLWANLYSGAANQANLEGSFIDPTIADIENGLKSLQSQGIKNVVLVNLFNMSRISPQVFDPTLLGLPPGFTNPNYGNIAADATLNFNGKLSNINVPGLNIYYVDNYALKERAAQVDNPYGFVHLNSVNTCSTNACGTLTQAQQDEYLFQDFIHHSAAYERLLAEYAANIVNARNTLPAQAELGEAAGIAFSDTILTMSANGKGVSYQPVSKGSSMQIFAKGTYSSVDRESYTTSLGNGIGSFDADLSGITAGLQYNMNDKYKIGAAFNYLSTDTSLNGLGGGEIEMDSVQGALFASIVDQNLSINAAVTYGHNSYDLSRHGIIDTISGSTDGSTFTAAMNASYLFNVAGVKLGPIAELSYRSVSIDGYVESGDSILTMGVKEQNFDNTSGGIGLQIKKTFETNSSYGLSTFLNVTAQKEFGDDLRTITSFQTSAPNLLVNTLAAQADNEVFGKIEGGISTKLDNGVSLDLSGSSTFGKDSGDDYLVNAGVKVNF